MVLSFIYLLFFVDIYIKSRTTTIILEQMELKISSCYRTKKSKIEEFMKSMFINKILFAKFY